MEELRVFLCAVAEEEGLSATVNESLKGGLLAGMGAGLGGLIAGPAGIFLGGAAMSAVASRNCKKFEPLHRVLRNMSDSQWRKLKERFSALARSKGFKNALGLMAVAVSGSVLRKEVELMIIEFATGYLGLTIKN